MTNFDAKKYLVELENAGDLAWDQADGRQLASVLNGGYLRKALAIITAHLEGNTETFITLDLTQQQGVASGIRLQGRTEGVISVLERLCALAEEGNEDDGR